MIFFLVKLSFKMFDFYLFIERERFWMNFFFFFQYFSVLLNEELFDRKVFNIWLVFGTVFTHQLASLI